jgi:hypothetical protein
MHRAAEKRCSQKPPFSNLNSKLPTAVHSNKRVKHTLGLLRSQYCHKLRLQAKVTCGSRRVLIEAARGLTSHPRYEQNVLI